MLAGTMVPPPVIRSIVLCDNVRRDSDHPQHISLDGLLSTIHSLDEPPYPLLFPEICVFVQLTECRGAGEFYIQIFHPDTEETIFRTKNYRHHFGHDPLEIH